MTDKVLAVYERQSTLWKNANAFYTHRDWTKMECIFRDNSKERNLPVKIFDSETGADITEKMTSDLYIVRLTNKRGTHSEDFTFYTRDEANSFFKSVLNHKVLVGWKKVFPVG